MEETKNHQATETSPNEPEELELNHTDKLVGVFSEPINTFSKMSALGPKTSDWLIPVIIFIVVAILSNILMMSNPAIKSSVIEKQMARLEKNFDDAVAKGQMTEAQKEQQLETIRERMERGGIANTIFSAFGILIFTFISFFIVSGVFFLLTKLILKGNGTYKDAMSAYGLPYYIFVIQVIVMVILAFATDKFFTSTSLAAFIETEQTSFTHFVLSKLDIFSIWFYAIVSIGFAKMFKSQSLVKYFVLIFCMWIGFGLILFLIAKAVPFLSFLSA
ncbi:MAG: Yip1 family protein [Melioribacter sp.]|uniref:Yip1 family protein n=1 Tax=Rosettibacter primus TaxID=3111523 RepID=UPI00247E92A3|nr:Yip1 family protein [Melioribacter sp.]